MLYEVITSINFVVLPVINRFIMLLNYITWNIDPEIFHIGGLSVRWYGLMFASAFLFGYLVFVKYLRTERLSSEMLDVITSYSIHYTKLYDATSGRICTSSPTCLR